MHIPTNEFAGSLNLGISRCSLDGALATASASEPSEGEEERFPVPLLRPEAVEIPDRMVNSNGAVGEDDVARGEAEEARGEPRGAVLAVGGEGPGENTDDGE